MEVDKDKTRGQYWLSGSQAFELIFNGGMPELYDIPEMDRNNFYNSYINTYIERDVRKILILTISTFFSYNII